MDSDILCAEGLHKSFNGTVAVDGVSFTVESGEFRGIIGPNGSGKTTLFDLLTGFQRPDRGRVWFEDAEITDLPPDRIARRGLVRTFQVTTPFEGLSVRDNLLAAFNGGAFSGIRVPPERRERAENVLERLDLHRVADNEASDISGGQAKLLELGRALVLDPECLLLDEPTAGVNPALESRLLSVLEEENQSGTTIVLIEHDMNVVERVTDRVTVLDRGQILTQGSVDAVTASPDVRRAYLGSESDGPDGGPVVPTATLDSGVEGQDDDGAPGRLVARDLVAGYGNHRVLQGVTVESHDGITCVLGPNGSGKSTLLDALAGVLPVWSGSITIDSRPLTGKPAHEFVEAGITMVPQEEMVFGGLTVRENLRMGAMDTTDAREVDSRLASVLETFPELEAALSERVAALSGGEQTMVGFGRAMMSDGDVYLLDEPTSSLAPSITADIFEMIEALVADGSEVILVEQNVTEALPVADHVYLLARGEVQFDGTPAELDEETDLLRRYLGIT